MTSSTRPERPSDAAAALREGWRLIAGPTPGPTEADLAVLRSRRIVMLGFGNQARAQAMNLRDAGVRVAVALRASSGRIDEARRESFEVLEPEEATALADLVIVAIPDRAHAEANEHLFRPFARSGTILGFLHGHSIHAGEVVPREDLAVIMVAPKGPGSTLRERFVQGQGIPALVAVAQDPRGDAREVALAFARGIGCGRSGLIETTFAAETIADLFGEQAVLCGGVLALASSAFEVLVERGAPPELAYLECIHELKQVVDLLYARGPSGMRAAISETAEFGALEVWSRRGDLVDRGRLEAILDAILSGEFSRRLAADQRSRDAWLRTERRNADEAPLEPAGRAVRSLMPWLEGGRDAPGTPR
ncbi:MAG: ketol-acid reductoisomerase [Phycisphaerae bacterium]|nr:ketol-acid reductoisomerase [Phycisphaerae bacterium]